MKIEINLKIIVVLILFLMINNIEYYILFMIFIILHELIHLIVGVLIGGVPKSMKISIFGVSLELYLYGKINTLYKIIFYFSGPLINILIASILLYINKDSILIEKIIFINFSIGIFNLLPILPLDGGKILREIVKKFIGVQKANKFMIYFSKCILVFVFAVYSILILKVKNVMILFLLIYLWYLYSIEEKKYILYEKTYNYIKDVI